MTSISIDNSWYIHGPSMLKALTQLYNAVHHTNKVTGEQLIDFTKHPDFINYILSETRLASKISALPELEEKNQPDLTPDIQSALTAARCLGYVERRNQLVNFTGDQLIALCAGYKIGCSGPKSNMIHMILRYEFPPK